MTDNFTYFKKWTHLFMRLLHRKTNFNSVFGRDHRVQVGAVNGSPPVGTGRVFASQQLSTLGMLLAPTMVFN